MSATAQAPRTSETPEALASDLCWLLSRASHALTTECTQALEGSGISPRDHSVLATATTGAHTQIELARLVGLDKTTMVVTVDALEAAALAEAVLDRVRDDVLAVLDPAERKVFLSGLSQLACARLADPVVCAQPVRRRV
jgi:DNA-binding MarR family transcriptional regulator